MHLLVCIQLWLSSFTVERMACLFHLFMMAESFWKEDCLFGQDLPLRASYSCLSGDPSKNSENHSGFQNLFLDFLALLLSASKLWMLKGSVAKGKEADGGWREEWNALADREFNSRKQHGPRQLLRTPGDKNGPGNVLCSDFIRQCLCLTLCLVKFTQLESVKCTQFKDTHLKVAPGSFLRQTLFCAYSVSIMYWIYFIKHVHFIPTLFLFVWLVLFR